MVIILVLYHIRSSIQQKEAVRVSRCLYCRIAAEGLRKSLRKVLIHYEVWNDRLQNRDIVIVEN